MTLKEISRFTIAFNQSPEGVYDTGKSGHEYAVGLRYEITPMVRRGMESKGSYTGNEFGARPTDAWIDGRIWAHLGAVFVLNKKTNDCEIRFFVTFRQHGTFMNPPMPLFQPIHKHGTWFIKARKVKIGVCLHKLIICA